MKANKYRHCAAAILLAMLTIISCLPMTAFAAEGIHTERDASLCVYFGQEAEDFPGVAFRLYRVADISPAGDFVLSGDFAAYPVAVNGLSSSAWRALGQTLAGYVQRDHLQPLAAAETDQNGQACFTGLGTGLYLVIGDTYEEDGHIYTPEAVLVSLPDQTEAGEWNYDVAITCKYDHTYPQSETITRTVQKIWEDDGNEEKRPEEIVVQLLRDGVVADTVTLHEANAWQYTWSALDADANWQVVEYETPEGYTVTVEREGATFLMTNTYPDDTPDPSPTPSVPPEKLPQTGLLWWPVYLLIGGGLLLLLIGVVFIGRRHGEHNGK